MTLDKTGYWVGFGEFREYIGHYLPAALEAALGHAQTYNTIAWVRYCRSDVGYSFICDISA